MNLWRKVNPTLNRVSVGSRKWSLLHSSLARAALVIKESRNPLKNLKKTSPAERIRKSQSLARRGNSKISSLTPMIWALRVNLKENQAPRRLIENSLAVEIVTSHQLVSSHLVRRQPAPVLKIKESKGSRMMSLSRLTGSRIRRPPNLIASARSPPPMSLKKTVIRPIQRTRARRRARYPVEGRRKENRRLKRSVGGPSRV